MTPEEQRDYVKYRMERAYDTAEEAKTLFEEDHLHGAVNRVYYAMFYAVSALALAHGFSTSSHAQLRGYFNREFVKNGRVPIPLGRFFQPIVMESQHRSTASNLVSGPTSASEC